MDNRPICTCHSYPFPHRVGGKCTGAAFTEFYSTYVRAACIDCGCKHGNSCDVTEGRESIKEAECYQEHLHSHPGERLPLELTIEMLE